MPKYSTVGTWVCLLAATVATPARAEGPQIVQQTSGKCSANIVGNDNHVVINCSSPMVSNYLLRSLEKSVGSLGLEFEDLKRRTAELEAARRSGDATVAELQVELRAKTEEVLAKDERLRVEVAKNLARAVELNKQANQISDPDERTEFDEAVVSGDLDKATLILRAEHSDKLRVGILGSVVSDQHWGSSGFCGGLFWSGSSGSGVIGRAASLTLAGSLDALVGEVKLADRTQFLGSLASRAGPRVRLGAPWGVSFGVYYDVPILMYTQQKPYFPLVGIAADVGIQYGLVKLTALYRYDFNDVLYDHRPNLSFFGIGLTGAATRFGG